MTDLKPEYLLSVVDEKTMIKIWKYFKGCRLYFPKCKIEHYEIKEDFKDMIRKGVIYSVVVNKLMDIYGLTRNQIVNIVGKNDRN